jgi:hypothetical protein
MYSVKSIFSIAFGVLVFISLTSCGGGDSVSTDTQVVDPSLKNITRVVVDAGPTGGEVNRLYTDVTICQEGNSGICQTIDHVLVDTGSTGLRVLASELSPALLFNPVRGNNGRQLLSCVQFLDNSFAWGSVVVANVVLGGLTAPSIPIQVVADPRFVELSSACAGGTSNDSVEILGAKGILGIGTFREDCGIGCENIKLNGFYYECANASCRSAIPTTARVDLQLRNPVTAFAGDNNGFVIDLPTVPPVGTKSVVGSIIFGIHTKANNQAVDAVPLMLDAQAYINSEIAGKNFPRSFFDTGSNGLYFDSSSLMLCEGVNGSGFYCPSSAVNQIAKLSGAERGTISVAFTVSNALRSFENAGAAVLPFLAGPLGDPEVFDWGLPFFFGRRVFVGIEGASSPWGVGPYYAF